MCVTAILSMLVYNIFVSVLKMITYRITFAAAYFPQESESKYLSHFDSLYDSVNKVYSFQTAKKAKPGKEKRCFFLHGNGSAAPFFFNGMGDRILKRGYTVIIPEYRGYGNRKDELHTLNVQNVVKDLVKQWNATMGEDASKEEERILAGVSLGGAFSHQIIDQLNPPPTKVVLMNTFSNQWHVITKQYEENVPSWAKGSFFIDSILWPIYYCCTATELFQWTVQHGHRSWKGPVSIVSSEKDELFEPVHAEELSQHFESKGCVVRRHPLLLPTADRSSQVFHHMQSFDYDESWVEEF